MSVFSHIYASEVKHVIFLAASDVIVNITLSVKSCTPNVAMYGQTVMFTSTVMFASAVMLVSIVMFASTVMSVSTVMFASTVVELHGTYGIFNNRDTWLCWGSHYNFKTSYIYIIERKVKPGPS